MSAVIQVNHLSKQYRDIQAVSDLSFSVQAGEVYGFLGQNGAGKSTTIRMLLTLVEPSAGEIEMFGMNLRTHRHEILSRVGAVIERPDLYKYLTAYENLKLFARMSGADSSRGHLTSQLAQVGLDSRKDSKVKTFSQGMKQRLGLAVALVHNPQLIILDEPTNGLDPQGIADVRNLILHLSRHLGKTVVVSSHLLSEIELIADRMLIIDKGKKIVEGSVKDLFDPSRMMVTLEAANPELAATVIRQSPWHQYLKKQSRSEFVFELDKSKVPQLAADLSRQQVEILCLQPRHSLEEYFLSLTTANKHVDDFEN